MANIEIIVKKLIDIHVKDADVYVNNGSLWLIFTEEKKWVIDLDKNGNLWYNYHFFSKIFKLISMNVVEKQHYITRWVEDALQNGVNHTQKQIPKRLLDVEDTIQNGVKRTWLLSLKNNRKVEDTLQNGVKKTLSVEEGTFTSIGFGVHVEDVLQNGVKETRWMSDWEDNKVEDTIQNGVKI